MAFHWPFRFLVALPPALDLLISAKLLFVVAKSGTTDVRPRNFGSFYLVADKPVLLFAAINLLLRAVL
jgi:hypothetical protein